MFSTLEIHAAKPKLSTEVIVFQTNFGDIAVRLYPEAAPKTSEQILSLARDGAYNGAEINRIIPDFIVQVDAVKTTRRNVPYEKNGLLHGAGRLSLAHQLHDLGSGNSSFSFMLGPAFHLDGSYTVFGEVIKGWDIVMSLSTLPRFDDTESPSYQIIIIKAVVMPYAIFKSFKMRPAPDLTENFKQTFAKPYPKKHRTVNSTENVLYSFVLALMFLIASVLFGMSKKMRVAGGLVLLAILVLVYGLVEYTMSHPVFPVSWAGVGMFVLVLITLRLMSRFENI